MHALSLVLLALTAPPAWREARLPWRLEATLPAATEARHDFTVELPADFAREAVRLSGRPGFLDPASLQVVPVDGGPASPAWSDDGRVRWPFAGVLPAGEARRWHVYFQLVDTPPPPARPQPALPDYATEAFGQPWDFANGGLASIDHWGDKPEYVTEKTLVDGMLHLKVNTDPYFIWGTMWGPRQPRDHQVDIDLSHYHRLEIRCRQSLARAPWILYGRVKGSDRLLPYEFTVGGTGWQTVRIDLVKQARWQGHLSAFRINPTKQVEATVDLAWVRLLAVDGAVGGAVETLGQPSAPAAKVALSAPAAATVGSEQRVTVRVTDAAGRPVSGQPVSVVLSGGKLGEAVAPGLRRGLTDARGELAVRYTANTRAGTGADVFAATADFTAVADAGARVDTLAGPPARLVVSPTRAVILARGERTCRLTAQVADAYGNPLPLAGRRVTLAAPAGVSLTAPAATGADGSTSAVLTLDPARCWVAWVDATDADGLTGRSAGVCYTPDQRDWGVKVGDNGYFTTGAASWLPLGGFYANWVGDVVPGKEPGRVNKSFVDADDAAKLRWLKFLADQGVTAERFMLRAHRPRGMEPLDIGGKVNPELYAEVLHYLDLARPFGIRFLLVLHEDYTKPMYVNAGAREQFCLPRWADVDLDALPPFQRRFVRDGRLLDDASTRYVDPDVRECQDLYAREVVGLFKDNPQVFAYELENEQVDVPVAWVNHQCEVIRGVDPRTPICMSHGGGGLRTADPLFWRRNTTLDFYTYHLYPDSTVRDNTDYGLACDVLARYGRLAGKSMYGESVGDEWSAGAPEAMRRRVARDIVWFALVEGNPGVFFWNSRGYEVEEFKLAAKLTAGMDFRHWQRAAAPTTLAILHPLDNDGWYRTSEGTAALRSMSQATQERLRTGEEYDYTWDPRPAGAPRAWVKPSPGFEAASWVRSDGTEGLTYVRNVAGTEVWRMQDKAQRPQLVRTIAPRPCVLTLAPGKWTVEVADLVDKTVGTRVVEGTLDLGTSEHDFGLRWRAAR